MAHLGTILSGFVALSLGCSPPAASAAPEPPPVAPLLQLRPALQEAVDALKQHHTIESSHIGAAAAPSSVHAAWEAVRREASASELVTLLGHGHVVVRGYAAKHLTRSLPTIDLAMEHRLSRLLRDQAAVRMRDGCMGGQGTIAAVVLDELCWNASDKVTAQAIIREVAADPSYGAISDAAKRCVRK